MKKSAGKLKSSLLYILSADNLYSILFYLVLFYLLFVYVAIPAVYALTPVSYISSVVSSSMDHASSTIQLTYYDWLAQHGYNSSVTSKWPFQSGIPLGSLAIAYKTPPQQIKVGDVIIYDVNYLGKNEEIIHRVVSVTVVNGTYYYTTKGDANPASLPFEFNIRYGQIVGKVNTDIPYLGYPRYLLYLLGNMV